MDGRADNNQKIDDGCRLPVGCPQGPHAATAEAALATSRAARRRQGGWPQGTRRAAAASGRVRHHPLHGDNGDAIDTGTVQCSITPNAKSSRWV